MEKGVIVLSVVVGLFGVGSAILGFIAEATKLTIGVSRRECAYPGNPAFALGLCAFLLLLVAQITASVAGGCCSCCMPRGSAPGSKRVMGVVFSVLSWIAAVIAGLFFLQGATWNAPVTRESAPGCYYVKDGVFRRAAVLSLVAAALGIQSNIMLRAARAGTAAAGEAKPDGGQQPQGAGIAIGQPAQGYAQAPNAHFPPAQGYGQFPPPAHHSQGYAQAV